MTHVRYIDRTRDQYAGLGYQAYGWAHIDEPAITHSLRGMTYIEIHVQGPSEDLHSGFWGGATHNPALAPVIAKW